jgi:putative radical SAM enzyme (TIGR03279 family)
MLVINTIDQGSLGQRAGFLKGDRILSVNGEEIEDLLDYQVNTSEQYLVFELERGQDTYEVEVERQANETLGIEFEEMKLRRCNNQCVFCFIHQMPKGMRRSLYFEDDDFRLSFLHGSYVTLTNVREKDLDRIIENGLSPQYISVHATDPALRQTMLGRSKPTANILDRIARLAKHQIEMHAQVVVCPGWNDGPHLERTVRELSEFYPAVRSIALVPVGLTKFRDRLPQLKPVTTDLAQTYVQNAEAWGNEFKNRFGERLVYLADELFLRVGRLPPTRAYYDAFPQIENGIGMVRHFLDTFEEHKPDWGIIIDQPIHIALVTGRLARPFLDEIAAQLSEIPRLRVEVVEVVNDFFGQGITVSGLLTGEDICRRLKGGDWNRVFLPPNCINGEGLTLDDLRLEELEDRVKIPISLGGYDIIDSLQHALEYNQFVTQGQGRQLSELGYHVGRD